MANRPRGFSLLEVMVAVAILGLALTVILSAQAGLFSSGARAQKESLAIGMIRCKMGEIEERLIRLGYPEVDSNDEGLCCQDSSVEGMTCEWKIQRVELPQPPSFAGTNPAGSMSSMSSLATMGSSMASPGGMGAMGPGNLPMLPNGAGAIGTLFGAGANDAGLMSASGGGDGGLHALGNMMGASTPGGVAGLARLVMSIVYPSLKPMLEASIRKIVLTVKWKEGLQNRQLKVTHYVTNPMRGGFMVDPNASNSAMPGFDTPGASTGGKSTPGNTSSPFGGFNPMGGFR